MTVPATSLLSPAKKALLLAAGVCLFASAAAAQPAAPPAAAAPAPAQVAPPAVVNQEARSFVQAYTMRSGVVDQIPRWQAAVCVEVRGLVADQAAKVAARIQDVAKGVGLKTQKPGCTSNIQILFTGQPQAIADRIGEAYLGYHYRAESKKLRAVTRPIQGWYATLTSGSGSAYGLAFAGSGGSSNTSSTPQSTMSGGSADPSAWESNFGQIGGMNLSASVVDSPEHDAPTGCADSRFSSCMKSMFLNVLIIADSHAIGDKDLGVLTDYVAMLALSQPKSLDGCNALPSVIDLLAKTACPNRALPDGLTPADAAYLTALYASDPEAKTNSAEGDIAGHMAKILIKANAVAR